MKTTFIALCSVLAISSAQNFPNFPRRPFVVSSSSSSGSGEGKYVHDNSGAYKNDDGQYRPDNTGQYVHNDQKYFHDIDKYKHQADKFGFGGGNGANGVNHHENVNIHQTPSKPVKVLVVGTPSIVVKQQHQVHEENQELPVASITTGSSGSAGQKDVYTSTRFGAHSSGQNVNYNQGSYQGSYKASNQAVSKQGSTQGSYQGQHYGGRYENNNYAILRKEENVDLDGYHYLYETENGITGEEQGKLANVGSDTEGMRAHGFYTYTGDDNVQYTVKYTADENGFQPVGDHLPTPPPIPQAILRALEYQRSIGTL